MSKIIIDTDPGIDDTLAIILADKLDYDISGITLVSGNVHRDKGLINLFRISKFLKRQFNIYIAEQRPIIKDFVNAEDTHGIDGLGETFLDYDEYEYKKDGVKFIVDSLKREFHTIFALGPLTNIAKALERDREVFKNSRLIIMGGSFKSHGNTSPVAEYNFWVDPEAAEYVFKNYPNLIEVVPLDVTRKFVLTPNIISLMKRCNSSLGRFIEDITGFYMDFHWEYEDLIGCVINDPLTIILEKNKDLFKYKDYFCEISTDGITRGQMVVDEYDFYKRDKNTRVYIDLNEKEAMEFFFNTLFETKIDLEKRGII